MIIIKKASKKLFILGIVFFMIMSISGIYAATISLYNGNFNTSGIDIKIQIYKLNSENALVKYDDNDKIVLPSEVVSLIPIIENNKASCYLRTKIFFIDNNIEASNYITGISNEWKKCGDYYYFLKPVSPKEKIKLFDTFKIPDNIREITTNNKIKLEIVAEAIQDKNFEPDYTMDDPWKGINPVQSTNIEYDIDTKDDKNATITYENGVNEDVKILNDFFDNMKDVMPGDTYNGSIIIKNTNKENAKYYLKLNLDGLTERELDLLNEIDLVITNKSGKVIYNGKAKYAQNILLGNYNIGEEDEFNLKISIPLDLSNKYVEIYSKLNWTFSVDYDKDNTKKSNDNQNKINPQTGDKINVSITIFLISTFGLIVVMLLDYKEKRNIE